MLKFLILLLLSGMFGRADGASRRVCEGHSLTINCGSRMRIHILGANYGRLTGRSICGWGPIRTTNCRAAGSLAKVQHDCNGRSSCVLPATNSKFGDPCFGTYKYLQVSYKCVQQPGTLLQVCEHHSRVIVCPSSKRIKILSANYGRLTGRNVCGSGPIRTTNCRAAGSLAKVQHDCNGRSSCALHATNSKFGDPCFGTYKYLQVSYKCVQQPGTLLQVCEHHSRVIVCPSSKRIKILSANYGRLTGRNVCGSGPIRTTNCRAAGSLAKVQHDCNGRSSCALHATNSKFGDPCFGTYKYLQVSYKCVQQPSKVLQVCEGRSHGIYCPSPKQIQILSANYGRLTGRNVCGSGPIRTTNCRAAGSLAKVQHDCHGRSSCVLHATNSKFGDPCFGTYKYLQVSYKCVQQPGTLLQVCEHHSRVIVCPSSKRIKILSANYGRLTGRNVCGSGPIRTTNCRAAGSLAKVQHDCNGRSSCVLRATNSKFGDPCYGTYKYLQVRYICV